MKHEDGRYCVITFDAQGAKQSTTWRDSNDAVLETYQAATERGRELQTEGSFVVMRVIHNSLTTRSTW